MTCMYGVFQAVTGVDFVEGLGLENIVIPKSNYLILEARNEKETMHDYRELLKQKIQILTEKMPDMRFVYEIEYIRKSMTVERSSEEWD